MTLHRTPAEISAAFEEVFDQAVVFHGFTDFMRDYDVIIYATADSRTGIPPEHVRYRFTKCVQANAVTAVRPDVWAQSLDDLLTDYSTGVEMDGYVWGVKWQALYPGMKLIEDSAVATKWSGALGIPFHEARIETNGHNLSLVFSELDVVPLDQGWSPFTIEGTGPDWKIPLP